MPNPDEYQLPVNIHAVSVEMTLLDNRNRALMEELIKADNEATEARYEADKIETLAFVRTSGSMELRKQTAREAALAAEWGARTAELKVRALKLRLREVESRADTLGKIGNSIKTEMKL